MAVQQRTKKLECRSAESPWTVLVVDGHSLSRFGIVSLLQNDERTLVCGETDDPNEARRLCQAHKPHFILIDPASRQGGGLGLIEDCRKLHAPAILLAVSDAEDAASLQRAFRSGARGYVSKLDNPAEILTALEVLKRGQPYASRRISNVLLSQVVGG